MKGVFDVPRTLVFDAFSKPELLRRRLAGPPGWLLVVCPTHLNACGTYRYVGQDPAGDGMGIGGVERPGLLTALAAPRTEQGATEP